MSGEQESVEEEYDSVEEESTEIDADTVISDYEELASRESEVATNELQAFLSEWLTASVHRVTAFSMVLGAWKSTMESQGFPAAVMNEYLPLMMERLWPAPNIDPDMVTIGAFYGGDDDD